MPLLAACKPCGPARAAWLAFAAHPVAPPLAPRFAPGVGEKGKPKAATGPRS